MTRIKMAVLAAAAHFAVVSAPVAAQDDDDDEMSGGALAVLLLAVGGSVSGDGLQAQLKSSLDQQRTPYSDAQLKSLTERTAIQIKAQRIASEFTVCADGGRPCVKVVRK